MTYRITFVEEGGVLVAHVSGQRPEPDADAGIEAAQGWRRLADEANARGATRLLVRIDVLGEATSTNAQRQAALMASFGFQRHQRIACVYLQPRMLRVNRLGTLLAAEQGWHIRSFETEAEARAWLTADPPA